MNRRTNPRFKFDRRISENIWGTRRSSFVKNQSGPGQHGLKRKSVVSDYGIRLLAKQKLKFYYSNLTESKLKKTYEKASKYKGNVAKNLIRLLELRLDVLVHRAGLSSSFRAARQLINHKHILVNNKIVNTCSYECKPGDIFRIIPKYINSAMLKHNLLLPKPKIPNHITSNYKYLKFKVTKIPEYNGEIYPTQMCPELIVEFYSGLN